MQRHEAETVLGLFMAGYPNETLEDPSVTLWINRLEMLDAEVSTKLALWWIDNEPRMPTINQFRSAVNRELSRLRDEEEREHRAGLPRGPVEMPEWVWVWSWMRRNGDGRSLPQQEPHVDPTTVMSSDDYATIRNRWISDGAPKEMVPVVRTV